MKRLMFLLIGILVMNSLLIAQEETTEEKVEGGIENSLFKADGESKVKIGGYGQIDYNQDLDKDIRSNGKLDVHRLIIFAGYEFNERTRFVTEIEFEHVKEVYIEQAFLSYRINNFMNLKAGLLLIPMGFINEYHEPPLYNGVERPNTDKYIVPTTWREIGIGFNGNIQSAFLNYQVYLVNGFNGYDGEGKFSGKSGLRSGRQKGAESYISTPNFSAKLNYYGVPGLNVGLAGYFGKSQSVLFDGLDKNDDAAHETADSSVIGISMVGLDYSYRIGGFSTRGQIVYSKHSNVDKYNAFTGKDLGDELLGYYLELGYDIFHNKSTKIELSPFVRYENYNTHFGVISGMQKNEAYNRTELFAGFALKFAQRAVLKFDYQLYTTQADDAYNNRINAGVGIMF